MSVFAALLLSDAVSLLLQLHSVVMFSVAAMFCGGDVFRSADVLWGATFFVAMFELGNEAPQPLAALLETLVDLGG